ncbi:MAG: hypothetical protein F6K54_12535 [Okeania sp. SIO3B5]|uniref:hypothetical protein n=1 Tax=Okeania sp. SIO3B5 TaxID=2607811 RepID=UPI0013FF3283|nr:hypothetical protein [Okeania sp. SIO3B5]NEO53833.1 hypothetical protein [Okeania sp. SIO3B5]
MSEIAEIMQIDDAAISNILCRMEVVWETVQLAGLAQAKKLFPYGQVYALSSAARCYPTCTNNNG